MFVRILFAAVALAVAVAAPATAAVKDSSPSGFTVENSAVVATDRQTTWNALVEEVGRWWPRDHTWWGQASELSIQPRAGGCFCETNGNQQAQHLTVSFVDPGRTLRMTGGLGPLQGMGLHGALEFRLEDDKAGGTRVTLWYRAGGYTPDDLSKFAPVVDQVQALQLKGLVDYLRANYAPIREDT
ncbi:SRPBCC domain-containing protein [Arenimonas sp. MALMAid1274]|uniref:SRPBCC domain-containing protein n=1 Tax=Arenimonas sp. MALMAid1274 TaxID=3411630 RepID=UPI003B9F1361